MSSVTNGKDVFLVDVHSEPSLQYGFYSHESIDSKNGDVSSTITSRVPSTSYEYGEAFSITMAHLGLLFHILAADYNIYSKLMLQDPYDPLGVTYSQEFSVSFKHGILFGSKFKSEEHHSLSHQCISVVIHGLRIHHATAPELVEHIPLLPKKNIPLDIFLVWSICSVSSMS